VGEWVASAVGVALSPLPIVVVLSVAIGAFFLLDGLRGL
jgi:hypothetical protein